MFYKKFLLFIGIINLLLVSVNLHADEKNPMIELYQNGNYANIITAYENNKIREMDEMSRIIIGMSYRQISKYDKSISILKQVQGNENIVSRAKLEIAITCAKRNDIKCANKSLDEIIYSENTAEKLKQYAISFKAKINNQSEEEAGPLNAKVFYGSVGLGTMYDSNPNMSTTSQSVYLYGIEVPQNQKIQSDNALMTSANIGYNYRLTKSIGIFGSAGGDLTSYKNTTNRDTLYNNVSQGIYYRHKRWMFTIPVSYNDMYIDRETMSSTDGVYLQMGTVAPSISYNLGRMTLRSSYRMTNKTFKDINARNSRINMFDQSAYFVLTKYTILSVDIGSGYENSESLFYRSKIHNASALLRQYIPNTAVYIDLAYMTSVMNFENYDPFLTNRRKDTFNTVKASIHYMPTKFLDLYASYSYTQNDSNVNLYQFDRNQIMTGFRLLF